MSSLDPKKGRRPIFIRLILTFLILSIIPILLYAFFTGVVYLGSVKNFLPAENAVTVEQILATQGILIFLLTLIMVIFASSFLSNSFVRPLKRLLELTGLVGEGNLNYHLKVTTRDEIGELTKAFNEMVDKLRHQKDEELKIAKMKSEFISVAAHQLRTPLSGIKWTLNMLINEEIGPLTPDQKSFLMKTHESNERMIALVNDMLSADRIESGKIKYKFVPIQVLDLIDNILFEIIPEANKKEITIQFEKREEDIPKISVDPEQMRGVFQNLLDNAIKYTRQHGIIKIGVKKEKDNLLISVSDSGIGIPLAEQDDIFHRFYRASNAVKQETDGSGLGLYIARSIIQKHGGDIWFASKENVGTTFHFTIPIRSELV